MALQTVLDTLDGIDDAVKPFYIETDGKFILQVSGVDNHPDVANLKSAYERTKADRDAARSERDAAKALAKEFPEDFDAEKWAKLKDGKADEAALIKLRQTLEAERDDYKGKYEAEQGRALKNALDRDLTDALNGAGVTNTSFAKAARTMLAGDVKIGDDGKPFVDTDMGPLALVDHVKRWAAGEGKDFVTPASGGGATGGKNGNAPANAETFAKMGDKERTALFHSDPETFRQLAGT